ncbi:calcyphosin-2 isoform X1 [Triplophysa dalaica]|uniref:calcyphosin-2 isoform X1 n=1 Tax=Triplophysa dalaica TaxID=1582913 RepID=UPI0024DF5A97|nr:calcyphosin-2 isoform X1 [Triplophysa dalaica]XP_056621765.1 calcyphosin-2 isoform X1 [Triplophysa dalaica]
MSENNKTLPIQHSPRRPKNGARHGPRPAEVPVLQLDTLQDTLNEYLAVIPKDAAVSRDVSAFSWGSPPLTNSNQCFETSITEKNLVDHGDSLQLSSRVPTQRSPLSTQKSNTDPPDLTSENPAQPSYNPTNTVRPNKKMRDAEGLTEERKLQAVIEQVMVDQLSRAVISDPEQNAVSVSPTSVPPRYTRTLHHTKVKTQTSLTENLLSNKLRFNARILSRCGREACRELIGFFFTCDRTLTVYEYRNFGKNRWNALPFIARGVYQNRGRPYSLQDISQGAELHFCTDGPHLPHSLRQQPRISLKVTDVDETAKRALLFQYGESLFLLSEEEINERNTLKAIQDVVRDRLRGRAVQTLIHLGRHLHNLDSKADSVQQKELLRKSLMDPLCLAQQDFEAVRRIVSRCAEGRVHPADVMRAVTGEMSENRKAVFLKVYVKLDPNKTGFISMSDVEKFYRGKQDSHTTHEADPNADFWAFIKQAGEVNKSVSYAQFEDYYEGLSIEIPDDEEYINNLRSMWGI